MSLNGVPHQIAEFLGAPTPDAWTRAAASALPELLVDHANCEKKAASTALALMFRYEAEADLVHRMSRLAREELRHFEQVLAIMNRRGIAWQSIDASRYARGLREHLRPAEPGRLIDLLVIGAFIEARSCERFALLGPRLDAELGRFYTGLLASEARHFRHYLELAAVRDEVDCRARVGFFRQVENKLVTRPDTRIRFHSGPPTSV